MSIEPNDKMPVARQPQPVKAQPQTCLYAADRKQAPIIPDARIRAQVQAACLEAMTKIELDAWIAEHRR